MADEQKGTRYVVLRQTLLGAVAGEGGGEEAVAWQEIGRTTAANDLAAIRAVVSEDDPIDSACVAVPERSFRPRKPQNQTIQKRLWS